MIGKDLAWSTEAGPALNPSEITPSGFKALLISVVYTLNKYAVIAENKENFFPFFHQKSFPQTILFSALLIHRACNSHTSMLSLIISF